MPVRYRQSEYQRRYRYRRWFINTERAEWRRRHPKIPTGRHSETIRPTFESSSNREQQQPGGFTQRELGAGTAGTMGPEDRFQFIVQRFRLCLRQQVGTPQGPVYWLPLGESSVHYWVDGRFHERGADGLSLPILCTVVGDRFPVSCGALNRFRRQPAWRRLPLLGTCAPRSRGEADRPSAVTGIRTLVGRYRSFPLVSPRTGAATAPKRAPGRRPCSPVSCAPPNSRTRICSP
jgi:hypothetical protein